MTRRVCTNDARTKLREVVEWMEKSDEQQPSIRALFARGAFHHADDVAYARIMLVRDQSVDEIAEYIAKTYSEGEHHCDPVYPSWS